jgi:hypothetical protein
VVERVEKFLNDDCSIGLPCWIAIATGDGDENAPGDRHMWLGYDRINGRFCIAIEQLVDVEGKQEHMGPRPWASCPRELKLTTLPKLPRLLQYIAEAAEKLASKNDAAVEAVNDILGAIQGPVEEAEATEKPKKPKKSKEPAADAT